MPRRPFVTFAVLCMSLAFPAAGLADTVTEWNAAALSAIRMNRTAPPVASRSLAMLHVAIYDAVNGILWTHEPYLVESAVPASASPEAAAAAAGYQVLTALFTSFSAAAREAADSRLYGGIHTRSANDDGLSVGMEIGEWAFTHAMQPKGNQGRK